MRLFIALNLPARERQAVYRAAAPLRDAGWPVRWVEPESLHVTLKFLGWVRPEDVDGLTRAMAEAVSRTRPFEIVIGGLGAFPSQRRPRVIWIGAEATPAMRSLKHDLEWGLASLGFEREDRAFRPHITLGRASRDARAGDFRGIDALFARVDHSAVVPVREVDLMRSHLSPTGARYERIASAALG
ncbi:MAG TPA: RNA 2',3'-cyclic phosphodiesterase [Longimicrobiales bacterium]